MVVVVVVEVQILVSEMLAKNLCDITKHPEGENKLNIMTFKMTLGVFLATDAAICQLQPISVRFSLGCCSVNGSKTCNAKLEMQISDRR